MLLAAEALTSVDQHARDPAPHVDRALTLTRHRLMKAADELKAALEARAIA